MPQLTNGQLVRIQLDKNFSLEGERAPREATFVAYLHGQPDWAVVEFKEKHHGGVKTMHVPIGVIEGHQ
jgi:hypothetical protein